MKPVKDIDRGMWHCSHAIGIARVFASVNALNLLDKNYAYLGGYPSRGLFHFMMVYNVAYGLEAEYFRRIESESDTIVKIISFKLVILRGRSWEENSGEGKEKGKSKVDQQAILRTQVFILHK
ncbi:uncharacterized protein A4U43_C04F6750 [Asparagus officinalis]|uniref:Uncharacterized protein n=1 Tax=Asparagus officinalis TaxID=4686 RepID=A0A5P1F485_ASPOF|nr:uncharacterized protein A4U43_C04F6750 [Asparagus officinalis]